jgi:hypothetical protein
MAAAISAVFPVSVEQNYLVPRDYSNMAAATSNIFLPSFGWAPLPRDIESAVLFVIIMAASAIYPLSGEQNYSVPRGLFS